MEKKHYRKRNNLIYEFGAMLNIEPETMYMIDNCFNTELHPTLSICLQEHKLV